MSRLLFQRESRALLNAIQNYKLGGLGGWGGFFHYLFFLFCLFLTLHLVGKTLNTEYIPDEYVLIAEKITAEVANKLSKRHTMRLFGETAGLADRVNILGLSFQIEGPIERNRLREILIDCVEEFLDTINKNERIRPHLKNYPFTIYEIEIALFIIDHFGEEVYHPNICISTARHGQLRYVTFEKVDSFNSKSEEEENYEDALKLVGRG